MIYLFENSLQTIYQKTLTCITHIEYEQSQV